MGKLVNLVAMLIFIDLLFIVTGQALIDDGQTSSVGSIIFNALLNVGDLSFTQFFKELIGDIGDFFNSGAGIGSLFVGAAVTAGIIFSSSDVLKFVPVAFTLGLLTSDFVIIAVKMNEYSPILTAFILAPIIIIYVIIVLEWLRVKD